MAPGQTAMEEHGGFFHVGLCPVLSLLVVFWAGRVPSGS